MERRPIQGYLETQPRRGDMSDEELFVVKRHPGGLSDRDLVATILDRISADYPGYTVDEMLYALQRLPEIQFSNIVDMYQQYFPSLHVVDLHYALMQAVGIASDVRGSENVEEPVNLVDALREDGQRTADRMRAAEFLRRFGNRYNVSIEEVVDAIQRARNENEWDGQDPKDFTEVIPDFLQYEDGGPRYQRRRDERRERRLRRMGRNKTSRRRRGG